MQKVAQHAVEIEIHKARPILQEERFVQQHFLERNQTLGELRQQLLLPRAPPINATAPELALLVAEEPESVRPRDHLVPVNIIELETSAFDVVLDVTPENRLHAFQCPGEQAEL